jgi:predicted MFS family arabinose efflux permease
MNQTLAAPTPLRGEAAIPVPGRLPVALALATTLGSLAFVTPPPMFPAMSKSLGVGVPLLGLVMATMLLAGALLSLITGPLADRHGPRRLLAVGAVSATGCLLGFALAPGYGALLAVALLGGLANATLPGLSQAIARTALDGAARQRAIGWITAGGAAPAIVGVPLLTLTGDLAGWRVAFLVAGGAAAGIAWFLVSALPPGLRSGLAPSGHGSLVQAWLPPLRHRPTVRVFGITVLRSITWYGLLAYLATYLDREVGLGARGIGVVYMIGGGAYFAGSILSGRLLAHLPARLVIGVANTIVALVVLALFGGTQRPEIALALIVLASFAGAASQVGTVTLLSTTGVGGAGTVMTLNGALMNLGTATGGALGGALLASGGFRALAAVMPIFALATLPLLARRSGHPAAALATPTGRDI